MQLNKVPIEYVVNYLQDIIDNSGGFKLDILEAGCGSISKFKFSNNHIITGIDISQKQLDRNIYIQKRVLGDIQEYNFPASSFDIIICWHVLEHLRYPSKAITNFIQSLKEDGRIVLASPNPFSLKGIVTKFTPHWFHVFIYRYIYGHKDAGKDDNAPFKTYLRFSIAPYNISNFAKSQGLQTEYLGSDSAINHWVGKSFKEKSKILFFFILFLQEFLKYISFGKISDSEFIIVIKKI